MAESDNAVEILKDIRDEIRGARNELRDEIRGVRTERVEAPALIRKRRTALIAVGAVAATVVMGVLSLHAGGKKAAMEPGAVETTPRTAPSMAGSSLPDPPIQATAPAATPPAAPMPAMPAMPSAPASMAAPSMAAPSMTAPSMAAPSMTAPSMAAPSMAARPGAAAVAKRTLARHRVLIAPRAELEEPAKL